MHQQTGARRPGPFDMVAAVLLLSSVALHVAAMFPTYFEGGGSLAGQPDQAAQYAVLAAGWALVLAVGLGGPHRVAVAASLAVGLAATELGFRLADAGYAVRYGAHTVGAGVWLMDAAWAVGAVAALCAVAAVRARLRPDRSARQPEPAVGPGEWNATAGNAPDWNIDWAALPGRPYQSAGAPPAASRLGPGSGGPPTAAGPDGRQSPAPAGDPTLAVTADPTLTETSGVSTPARAGEDRRLSEEEAHERTVWTVLVVVLAAVVAGAFLPAWDHLVAFSTVSGQRVSHSSGNVFSDPWQQVVGNCLVAVALLVVPAIGIRMRDRAAGAALALGSLVALASQLVSAVVQVDQPVPLSELGLTPAQAGQLGLQVGLHLTAWYTVETLATYGLFVAVMVWATLRVVHENSPGTRPSAPAWRSDAIPSAS